MLKGTLLQPKLQTLSEKRLCKETTHQPNLNSSSYLAPRLRRCGLAWRCLSPFCFDDNITDRLHTHATQRAQRRRGAAQARVQSGLTDGAPRFGLAIECDGILTDVHQQGHRVAFNKAFMELGLGCASWTPEVYHDLLRSGDGSAEGLIKAYFTTVGWPLVLPTQERPIFARKVIELKSKFLQQMAKHNEIPLRDGACELLDAALADGATVAVVGATASAPEENITSAVMFQLGPSRTSQIRYIYNCGASSQEEGGEGEQEDGDGIGISMEQGVAAAKAKMKAAEAANFVESLKGPKWGGDQKSFGMGVDPSLLVAQERSRLLNPAFLQAIALTLGVPLSNWALLAASSTAMSAAQGAGMMSVAVPNSFSARGRFAAADVQFQGFGPGGGATWNRIKTALAARS